MESLVAQREAQDSIYGIVFKVSEWWQCFACLRGCILLSLSDLAGHGNLAFEIVTAPSEACGDLNVTSTVLAKGSRMSGEHNLESAAFPQGAGRTGCAHGKGPLQSSLGMRMSCGCNIQHLFQALQFAEQF